MVKLGDRDRSAIENRRMQIVGRRKRVRTLAAVGAALVLAGCGWHPLYERPASDAASGGTGAALAQISIDPVTPDSDVEPLSNNSTEVLYDSRAAQLLQNGLKSALNPSGPPSAPIYHLAVQLQQQTRAAVSLGNGEATREDLIMIAAYQLNDSKGAPLLKDVASIVTSYDVLQEPFTDLSSRRDAQQRAAQELAQSIQTRLAVFLGK
jgi:hypothetical protein